MRVVGKFKDKEIRLNELHMNETCTGWLTLPSKSRMEEANKSVLKNIMSLLSNWEGRTKTKKECEKLFGNHCPVLVYKSEGLNLKELLPDVKVFAWLTCSAPNRDSSSHGSHLAVVWFQDSQEDPFKKLSEVVNDLDWASHAQDFEF